MKNINLHHLFLFYSIAKLKSITKAAESLKITQPAVSLQIKNFQKECGVQLLDIVDKKIFLTPVGKSLFFKCEELFALKRDAEEIILGNKSTNEIVNICTTLPFGEYYMKNFIPKIISNLKNNIQLTITEEISDKILERTLNMETDLGIVGKPVKHSRIVIQPLIRESLTLICSPNHSLADKEIIHPADLIDQNFIMHEPGSSTRESIENYATKNNISLNVVDEIYSPKLVADIVSETDTISIISRHIVEEYVKSGRLKSIPISEGLFRYFYLIYHKEKYISPYLKEVILSIENWCNQYNKESLHNLTRPKEQI